MSEWSDEDVVDEQLGNQKMVLVQAAAPATAYSGQVWVCTSSDPPLVKVYDATNTQWMERNTAYYRSASDGYKTQGKPLTLNGGLAIQYDSGGTATSGDVFLYFKANNLWWGVKQN